MDDIKTMKYWHVYPVAHDHCMAQGCDADRTKHTDEGVYCCKHWFELPKCMVCRMPASSRVRVAKGKIEYRCRECVIGPEEIFYPFSLIKSNMGSVEDEMFGIGKVIRKRTRKKVVKKKEGIDV